MYPGQDYVFPGNYVDEIPMAQKGLSVNSIVNTPRSLAYNNKKITKGITTLPEIPIHPPQHRVGDSNIENVWEILDPSGFSSYNDVYDSYQKTGMSPQTMIEIVGALPLLGKVGKVTKGLSHLAKTSRQARSLNNYINALKAASLTGRASDTYQAYDQYKVGGIPELPLTAGRKAYHAWGYTNNDFIVNRQEGGNAQDISVPSLNSFAPGGINTPTDLSPENLNYYLTKLRFLENSVKKGYKNKKWYPYESIEGGNDTIAYGHKILPGESFDKGITEAQAKRLQKKDALEKQRLAEYYVDKQYGKGTFDSLPQNHQMLLLDYQYNVSGGLNEFPNFTKALVESDKAKALSEYERENLGQRNQWTKDVLNKTYFPKQKDDAKPTLAEGGYKELELTPEEIEWYKANGYRVENID
jgi:hypothetical protein